MGNSSSCDGKELLDKSLASSLDVSRFVTNALGVSGFHKYGTTEVDECFIEFLEDETTKVRVNKETCYMEASNGKNGAFHDFLVLELAPFGGFETVTFVRAEKTYVQKRKVAEGEVQDPPPGGRIEVKSINSTTLRTGLQKKFEVDMGGSGEILVQQLLKDLLAHTMIYSLWKHNCWLYAYDTFDRLLRLFAELPDTSSECKERLQRDLAQLPIPRLPCALPLEVLLLVKPYAFLAVKNAINCSLNPSIKAFATVLMDGMNSKLGIFCLKFFTFGLKKKLFIILVGSVGCVVILLLYEMYMLPINNTMKY